MTSRARHTTTAPDPGPSGSGRHRVASTLAVQVGRRRILAYLVAAPVLAVATRITIDAAAPDTASAAVPSGPSVEELFDIADAIILAGAPTMPLVTLEIGLDGVARLEVPRAESGQGITTALAMILAEELDLPVGSVQVTCADARPELLFNQLTAGSASVRAFYDPLRVLAATARARMVAAAALRWGVPATGLSTADGTVVAPDGRTADYGSLTAEAARTSLGEITVTPKPESEHRVVGTPVRRADGFDIVTGRKKFTMDLDVPGATPTLLRRPPTMNGTVEELLNRAEVEAMPGVLGVVVLPSGVAVAAETFEQARAAADVVDARYGAGPVPDESNETIMAKLRAAVPPLLAPDLGSLPLGATTIDAEFEWPAACHAPLETECAVADVRADRAEVWSGFQAPIVAQQTIAIELGLPQDRVTAHVVPSGGAFGRRVFFEAAIEAAKVSQALERPIKLMWPRVDDMRHGRVRPPNFHRLRATVAAGQVLTFEQRVAGVSTDYRHGLGEILTATATALPEGSRQAVGNDAFGQAVFLTMVASPYNFGVYTKNQFDVNLGMPTASYRSVPCQTARGSEEIMVDEVAAALGRDPVEFRLEFLKEERAKAVVRAVAEAGDWGRSLPDGVAQGVGYHMESRAHTAALIELDARDPEHPVVTRAVIAVDVARTVNPLGLEAQMLGCLAEAISLTLTAGLHIENGLPLEGSYSQYHFVRQRDYPADVQVIIMPDNDGRLGGAGEVGMAAPT
ncbi:molybdopterin cofactor-binding domain-containing protein, partial [Pseudonocardia abyssalis]